MEKSLRKMKDGIVLVNTRKRKIMMMNRHKKIKEMNKKKKFKILQRKNARNLLIKKRKMSSSKKLRSSKSIVMVFQNNTSHSDLIKHSIQRLKRPLLEFLELKDAISRNTSF